MTYRMAQNSLNTRKSQNVAYRVKRLLCQCVDNLVNKEVSFVESCSAILVKASVE